MTGLDALRAVVAELRVRYPLPHERAAQRPVLKLLQGGASEEQGRPATRRDAA